jgi:hypothetical protein
MTTRRLLTTVLALSLAGSGFPAAAASLERPAPGPIRASIDRAIGRAGLPSKPQADGLRMATGQGGGGGGGGHAALFLVGLAVSAATTYFVIKAVQKQTNQTQTPTPTQALR